MQNRLDTRRGSHRPVALAHESPRDGSVGLFLFGLVFLGLIVFLGSLRAFPAQGEVNTNLADSPFVAVGRTVRPAVVNLRIIRSTTSAGIGTGSLQEMYRRFFPDEEAIVIVVEKQSADGSVRYMVETAGIN